MKYLVRLFILSILMFSCKSLKVSDKNEIVIAFGSCNKQNFENTLWEEILKNKPDLWIWGGDIVYSDTDDMAKMKKDYDAQKNHAGYKKMLAKTKILGVWDDHDYGLNDGGVEFKAKNESQQQFLDFMDVPKNDKRRKRAGIYNSEVIETQAGSVKIILLDTRYFRTALTKAKDALKRYQPNVYGEGTILGEKQWLWLQNELYTSKADFNIIISSIQFLSTEHGFETWGNFPHEMDKLKKLIQESQAKGVVILSGDRHISEFSKTSIDGVNYPLIDFTSSGLTHSYTNFKSEANAFRKGKVVSDLSFGILNINFETKTIVMQMRGKGNRLQQELIQNY